MYGVLNPSAGALSSGGEAVQHSLLAREFANQGWSVGAVCLDFGQPEDEIIDGVRVLKTYRRDSGLPGLRFIYPKLYKDWVALRKADADIYYQSCAGYMTGVVAAFAKHYRRKMVFRVAHDTDCIPGEQLITNSRDRWLYEYGLRSADLISVQSEVQADALQKNYGLTSVGVKMIVEPPKEEVPGEKDIDVLWVNNFRGFKRPDIVVDIARQMPDVRFTMIGGSMQGFEKLFEKVKAGARDLPNLDFVGPVPYSAVNSYFSRAKLFLNTSDSEGFPNSYLQAWIRGVPVVSYFDPDGLITSLGIGTKVASQSEFCAPIEALLKSPQRINEIGVRAREYANGNYSPPAIVQHYQTLFEERLGINPGHG
jgi:glycosyltransferase involved in cell wall biosynthesis